MKSELQPGDTLVHLAKVGSDFATGHGKLNQKTNSNVDMDGSHNQGFQTLLLSKQGEPIFKNNAPGGSELLRLFSKSTEKDSQERMVTEMEKLEKIIKEIPQQVNHNNCTFHIPTLRLCKCQMLERLFCVTILSIHYMTEKKD